MEELAVVYLSEGETSDSSDLSKCGEVFRSKSGTYLLSCMHCNTSFQCLIEFSQHIEEHFQLISIATFNDQNSESISKDVKDEKLKSLDAEPVISINDSHLVKKTVRKKVKQTVVDSGDHISKTRRPKVSKTSKTTKEPRSSMWICDICGKIFSTKNHIYQHMKLHRNAPKEHKCYLCGWEFYEKGNLTRHLRTHNNDPKAFKCDLCNKGTIALHLEIFSF